MFPQQFFLTDILQEDFCLTKVSLEPSVYVSSLFCSRGLETSSIALILQRCACFSSVTYFYFISAIDLVDEAAAKLKMEITSKPTELDEVDRAILKLEMEKLSLQNDTDKSSKERLSKLDSDFALLKQRQKEFNEQWDREKALMTRIRSIKEEVSSISCCLELPII